MGYESAPATAEFAMTVSSAPARDRHTPDWGTVVSTTAAGPILSGRRAPAAKTRRGTFIPTLPGPDRAVVAALTLAWIIAFVSSGSGGCSRTTAWAGRD